jgi:hypothetical protein
VSTRSPVVEARLSMTQVACLFATTAAFAVGVSALGAPTAASEEARLAAFLPGPATFARAPRLLQSAATGAFDPVAENARCEGCHAAIAAEWRTSEHHTAFTDAPFRAAYAVETTAFCANCHAPEDEAPSPASPASQLGVGCVSCHLVSDTVLAAWRDEVPVAATPAPHRVARSRAFAGSAACASCHDFSFGDDERRETPLPMQSTAHEHQRSAQHETPCATCHLPTTAPTRESRAHRSHAFASTRDPDAHRRAVTARVARSSSSPSMLTITLTLNEVGHAYPTGDLFRRVRVHAEVVGADEQILATQTVFLARTFALAKGLDGAPLRVERADSRVSADGRSPQTTVRLELGEAARGRPIRYEVAFERVLHHIDGRDEEAVLNPGDRGRVVLAEGEVGASSSMP